MFLTSGLYWTHLLCWIPFRVAPFSLDAPAVLGGSAWDPSKGAIALWGPRILFPLGVLAASGAPPSLSPWACLLRRNPLRVPPSPRARLLHGSASCVCCAASAVVGLPMTPCGVSHALFGLVFAYVFSEIALSCCVFAASSAVRGLGSCFPSLRLFACLCCRLSFGGVAMFHVKHFEACEKRTENVSRETFVCRNVPSEGASSAASLVALVRCRERSVLRASRGPCLVRDAPWCPGMGVKRAAWARAVEGGVADRRARRTRRTRRAQGVPLCAARSVRRRRCGTDGSRCSAGSLYVDSVACGGRSGGRRRSGRRSAWTASLRGVARGASLCGGWPRSGSRFAGTASLGVSSCDGVSPWAARRDGPIASGSRLPEGFARSGVRRASRVESMPEGTHDSAPLPSWGRVPRGPAFGARVLRTARQPGLSRRVRYPSSGYHLRVRHPGTSRAGAASAASPSGGRSAT